jgi:glycosyltransferase involved in cell wall biosynthesis
VITVIIPSWQRPQRTERAIRSVLAQTVAEWELLIVGDACPVLPSVVARVFDALPDDEFERYVDERMQLVHGLFLGRNATVAVHNLPTHEGRYGTQCLNWGIQHASGEYVCFLGNDDYVLPGHLYARQQSIEGTGFDVVFHDALLKYPDGYRVRESKLAPSLVGGSELIVRTELARKVGFQSGEYGHDWTFIQGLIDAGAKIAHCPSASYVVTHIPNVICEQGID